MELDNWNLSWQNLKESIYFELADLHRHLKMMNTVIMTPAQTPFIILVSLLAWMH